MEVNDNPELYKIRHSLAHIMAQAVQEKYPKVILGFGPPTDSGFYYDFDLGDQTITTTDLKDIEKRMKKIIGRKQSFEYLEYDIQGALDKLASMPSKEPLKKENIDNLGSRGIEKFSFYQSGPFLDLCEGPHVEHTGQLPPKAFKLDRVAGAYWLGDEKRQMLTRIYGLAFQSSEELQDFLKRRELAEKNDHRKLGKELDIYHIDEIVGKGLPLWLPNGAVIRDEIEKYAKEMEFKHGYQRVHTPHITKKELYLRSQHLPSYQESMFPPLKLSINESVGESVYESSGQLVGESEDKSKNKSKGESESESEEVYYLKPMNCPHHHLIYDCRIRSYRDLPLRLAEYGTCYRFEQSGELSGLIRVRCMSMNDAHIYLREEDFEKEFTNIMQMYQEFYNTFKLKEYTFRLSIRGEENQDKFKGDPSRWDRGEKLLTKVMNDLNLPYEMGDGEAAFYGPKIDVQFKNLMGREETVSTIQVDFLSPQNFDLTYIAEDGTEKQPIIIHRAPLSTHERFISFLIEYYGGAFPIWCSPVQVCIVPINDTCIEYSKKLAQKLHQSNRRVEVDTSNNSLNKKIRNNTTRKIPIILIIGNKEMENEQVTIRRYGQQEQKTIPFSEFEQNLQTEIDSRIMDREPMGSII